METTKPDMSCARVGKHSSADISPIERHNERKNESYDNLNVVPERIPLNVHYRDPGEKSYMEILREMEADGKISTRGLRQGATLFDEIVIDVNTRYFERKGGYEYAKKFYEAVFHFLEEKFGSENVISAVMHADEINKAVSDELGRDVYHYHLHAVVLPVVEKEILWSKRCKDPALRGTVKEVIHQISHSKKWASDIPLTDEHGNVILRKNGKPKYLASYSVLQDELFDYMQEHDFTDFQRGERGSTSENLKSLQYQIEKDKERLSTLQEKIAKEQVNYKSAHGVSMTLNEIENMGQKTITGKISIAKEDYAQLTALAKEGITSRKEIHDLTESSLHYRQQCFSLSFSMQKLQERHDALKEKCKPFLYAMEHFPDLVRIFVNKIKELFVVKEVQERREKEEAERRRQAEREARRQKNRSRGWER